MKLAGRHCETAIRASTLAKAIMSNAYTFPTASIFSNPYHNRTGLKHSRTTFRSVNLLMSTVFEKIEDLLSSKNISYKTLRHAPVTTSAEAAAVRGVPLASGAKALICKCDQEMIMFVMPADRKLAGKEVRRELGYRKLRFASAEEVWELTGLRPGSIPPFGSLFDIATICDPTLGDNARINFNAGDHAISISMQYTDYRDAENPKLLTCATAAT